MLEKERIEIKKTAGGEISFEQKPEEPKIPKELAPWLERIEKGEIYLAKPIIDDRTGQVLVTAPSAQKPKIILPLTRQKLITGLKQKTTEAIRWLAEWCLRLIKMKPNEVSLAQS